MSSTAYERWMWIELIGFDDEKQDFGVEEFFQNAGFIPDVVSLLLFNADFVHTHGSFDKHDVFPKDFCSYYGYEHSENRQIQAWTPLKLKSLISVLQQKHVKVYVAVFDLFASETWIGSHPELLHVFRDGSKWRSLCPWKRLRDGTWYEDFFIKKLSEVMQDYGFDGLHGADGYGHPRLSICQGDFSEDMLDQFLNTTSETLPEDMSLSHRQTPELIQKRADWIWTHLRSQWIEFYVGRIRQFWRKVARTLHKQGRSVVLNSAWTRDPFEAIYRYGIDYRGLVDDGIDGFVVETAAAAAALEGFADGCAPLAFYDFMAMGLLMKACIPEIPLRFLHGIKDTQEQFHALRHMPTLVEREALALSNLFWIGPDATLQRCYSGLVVCLADAITSSEWATLRTAWQSGYAATPKSIMGITVVWSDAASTKQVEHYIHTRQCPSHTIIKNLLNRGCPIHTVVNVENVEQCSGPLLVLHPALLPEKELESILDYENGPVVMIGGAIALASKPSISFSDVYEPDHLVCGVFGYTESWTVKIESDEPERVPVDLYKDIEEPESFLTGLYHRKVSQSFWQACAEIISRCVGGIAIVSKPQNSLHVMAMKLSPDRLRLLISNNRYAYSVGEIDLQRHILGVTVHNGFANRPLTQDNSQCIAPRKMMRKQSVLSVKVPPIGILVVDVDCTPRGGESVNSSC